MSDDASAQAKIDLIDAILSMDSYNRGYGSGINAPQLTDDGTVNIGNYTIIAHSNDKIDASKNPEFAAGFYAIAYRDGSGNVVISYRGTDNKGPFSDGGNGGSDLVNGYGLAFGLPGTGSVDVQLSASINDLGATQQINVISLTAAQAPLAEQFYNAVQGSTTGTITLTGHSLGGGLAGYVGSIEGSNSVLFDNMPFGVAANARAAQLGVTAQIGDAHGYYTDTEFLYGARSGQLQTLLGAYGLGNLFSINGVSVDGAALGAQTVAAERPVDEQGIDSHVDFPGLGAHFSQYHSISLLTDLLWNQGFGDQDWVPAGQQLWTAYFDENVADQVPGVANTTNTKNGGTNANTMQNAIAYSALGDASPGGALVFGDTAIGAMFDDAGDLGQALGSVGSTFLGTSVGGKTVAQMLADMLVQYAGALALDQVDMADGGRTDGILAYNDDILSVDLSSVVWHDQLTKNPSGTATAVTPVDGAAFVSAFNQFAANGALQSALAVFGFSSINRFAQEVWKVSSASQIIDRYDIATDAGASGTIKPRDYDNTALTGNNAHVEIFASDKGNDKVIGSTGDEILLGSGGGDDLEAGSGNDIVSATGNRASTTAGGLGADWIFNATPGGIIWGECRQLSARFGGWDALRPTILCDDHSRREWTIAREHKLYR